MPTGTTDDHPFAPRGTPSRDEVLAYARGELTGERSRMVEHAMECDPLLREAMEGLSIPGAPAGLAAIDRAGPVGGPTGLVRRWPWIGVVVITVGAVTWSMQTSRVDRGAGTVQNEPKGDGTRGALIEEAIILLDSAEIITAVEQPESLHIGHGAAEMHVRPEARTLPTEREDPIEPMVHRNEVASGPGTAEERSPRGAPRTSRQLHYLHDLKVVHPTELYGSGSPLGSPEDHVASGRSQEITQDDLAGPQRFQPYLDFMDEALGKFTNNEHKACLEDLRFLLEQYPDDVNALFYAGLCCYNLGMYDRARYLLHRSATHPIDSFEEESAFYHAMSLDRLGEEDAAREAFERIAARHGFYADRAREQLR